jgi:hypothetical protein
MKRAPVATPVEKSRIKTLLPWVGGIAVIALIAYSLRTEAPRADASALDRPADATRASAAPRGRLKSDARTSPETDSGSVIEPPPASEGLVLPEDAEPPAEVKAADERGAKALEAVRVARLDRTEKGTAALIASLDDEDDVVVAEAANALVARRATEAIAPIAKMDLAVAAGSGLSLIDALGRLGGLAKGAERTEAVDRLIAMLAEEKKRDARESPANLLQIYEALGETRDPRAAAPLGKELLDETVPRAPKVVIVAAIVKVGAPESHADLVLAKKVQEKGRGEDAFQEEIRAELIGAIDKALETL